jgi:tRNA G18 (ribose-2'-O)-methylase SpoU
MSTIHVADLSDGRLDVFIRLTDRDLRQKLEQEHQVMVVESPFALEVALREGLKPVSFLMDERHAEPMDQLLAGIGEDVPVFLAPREVMSQVVGFTVTRGVMGAFYRPRPLEVTEALAGARRVAVLEGLVDVSNVGAVFRSAAGLGFDAVLLDPTCADPLSRRAVRVSMGTVLQVPWARLPRQGENRWSDGAIRLLHEEGFHVAAMALVDGATPLDDPTLAMHERLALVFGSEGWGISSRTLALCDEAVIIPMAHEVDSLNVAASSAVAFWQLRVRSGQKG